MRVEGTQGGQVNEVIVDTKGRILVRSLSEFAEEEAARNGEAIIVHGECHLAASPSGALLALTNNSATKNIVLTRLFLDSGTLTTGIRVLLVKNPATTSGGTDISSTIGLAGVVNKNYGSGKTLDATAKMSDGSSDLTYTLGTNVGSQYHSIVLPSQTAKERDLKGTNIITKGKTLLLGWKTLNGGNATDGEIVAVSLNLYLVDVA